MGLKRVPTRVRKRVSRGSISVPKKGPNKDKGPKRVPREPLLVQKVVPTGTRVRKKGPNMDKGSKKAPTGVAFGSEKGSKQGPRS